MKENKVTILGEEIPVRFNMAVELSYEEIAGVPFNNEALASAKTTLALYMAAIITSKPDTEITFERLVREATGPEIAALKEAVIGSMFDWLEIPRVAQEEEEEEKEEEDKSPN